MIRKYCIFFALAFLLPSLFLGCSGNIDEMKPATGTLVIGGGESRAIEVNTIKSADVSVYSDDMETINESVSTVDNGRGSIEITGIPVGKNRVISVSAKNASGNLIDGGIMYAVTDIVPGVNRIATITWKTSRKGIVYNGLFKDTVEISKLTDDDVSKIDAAIPDVAPENILVEKIVKDWKNDKQLKSWDMYVNGTMPGKKLSYITIEKYMDTQLNATAHYTDSTEDDVTSSAEWNSTNKAAVTVSKGAITLVGAGDSVVTATYGGKSSNRASVKVSSSSGKIYLVPNSNWTQANAWFAGYVYDEKENNDWMKFIKSGAGDGTYEADLPAGDWTHIIFLRMNPTATDPSWTAWNRTPADGKPGIAFEDGKNTYTLNNGWDDCGGTWSSTASSGGKLSATITLDEVVAPAKPTITISPANGDVSLTGKVSVAFTANNDAITARSVKINGQAKVVSGDVFSINVSEITKNAGEKITVEASATSSMGMTTASASLTTVDKVIAPDTFTWDNVLCYFVLTDRFYNGDTTNDASYYRTPSSKANGIPTVALFHGGDIKGLTQKIDYFDNLGVNAIWITAPYEQIHGWVGGKNGAFPHYAFHGYYTLDWTMMDANMGTIDEFRQFVIACHEKGIRVVMDVVMNHVGYNNTEDMITYNYGYTDHKNHGWIAATGGKWDANDTVKWDNSLWDGTWFGPWIRSFGYESGTEYGGSCGGLPDVKTELQNSVGMAPVLVTKWGQDLKDSAKQKYVLPSVGNVDWNGKTGDWRTDKNVAPADYQVMWLSAWVREFGVDGFRCDTAKHVEPYRWGQLKKACESALEAWRKDSSKSAGDPAKEWDEGFWMTGECFGWTSTGGQGEYYTTGGFDSMINFSFNGSSGNTGRCPTTNDWGSYVNINKNGDSDNNGNRNSVLSYVSSHDTGLHRSTGAVKLGTYLGLLPGGVQIYYGDESDRPSIDGKGDADMSTRGDMNFLSDSDAKIKHWSRIGKFRKFNPAVGAGTGSAFKRTYTGAAGANKVAIGINGTTVDVSGLFDNGTTVYNWYDGKSAEVSGGKVTFQGGSDTQPILVSDRNPADYGVKY